MWYVLAASIAMIPLAYFAPKIRKTMAVTIPEVVGRRFGKFSSNFTAILSVLSLFCLTSSQIAASGGVINALIPSIPLNVCLIFAGIVIILYTTMGGMIADQISDLVQFGIILVGLAIATPIVLNHAGGWSAISAALPGEKLNLTQIGWASIIGYIFNYFCTFLAGPEMVSRFETAKDEKDRQERCVCLRYPHGRHVHLPHPAGSGCLRSAGSAARPGRERQQRHDDRHRSLCPRCGDGPDLRRHHLRHHVLRRLQPAVHVHHDHQRPVHRSGRQEAADGQADHLLYPACNVLSAVVAILISLAGVSIVAMNTFAFGIRCAGPFAAYGLGLAVPKATKNSGIISIICGTIAFVVWQIVGGGGTWMFLMPVVAGCLVSTISFFVVNWIEWGRGVASPPAPI